MSVIKKIAEKDNCTSCGSPNLDVVTFGCEYVSVECRDCNTSISKAEEVDNGNTSQATEKNRS